MRLNTSITGAAFGLAIGIGACVHHAPSTGPSAVKDIGAYELPSIRRGGERIDFESMIADMHDARAVLIGEQHDRLDHHLNQLEIIKRLHERNPDLAVGMEQFQQPFQEWLDRYVEGGIDTDDMLVGTEYFKRWKLDYRHYEPILTYAREHGIPVVALNVSAEVSRKVASQGLGALSEKEAARIPQLDRSNEAYRDRLRKVFDKHPTSNHGGSFENFYTTQLLWDESMAARAAEYLESHPGRTMAIIAGGGHVEYGSGIPDRLARRIDGDVVTVVHGTAEGTQTERADYILVSQPVALPGRGLLGVVIDPGADEARVSELMKDGAAGAAGVQTGDVIEAIDGAPVADFAGLKARLWDKRPGDRVTVTVRRVGGEYVRLDIELR